MNLTGGIQELEKRGIAPAKIEVSSWNDWTLASAFTYQSSKYISESVAMGVDKSPEVAIAKAITEYVERNQAKKSTDAAVKVTTRSDGFAAFPVWVDGFDVALLRARDNAFSEAVERYLWAKWWDEEETFFSIRGDFPISFQKDIQELKSDFHLSSVVEVSVPDSTDEYGLSILLARTAEGGFITGGAASRVGDHSGRLIRAFGELLRHALAVREIPNYSVEELSFYERRLHGFASGQWANLVEQRIVNRKGRKVELPMLAIDREITHDSADLVRIYRCLFSNQPVFMGGVVERLCI